MTVSYISARSAGSKNRMSGGGSEDSGKLRDDEDPGDVQVVFLKQYIAIHIDFASPANQMNGFDVISVTHAYI